MVLETGKRFLHVAKPDSTPGRALKGEAAGKGEVEAVFEAFPFRIGEQIAERGIPIRNLDLSVRDWWEQGVTLPSHKGTCFARRMCLQ